MQTTFNTIKERQNEQFSYWKEAVCRSYVHLDCVTDKEQMKSFQGKIQLDQLSRLSLSFVSGDAHTVKRRKEDIAKETDDSFLISLQLRNKSIIQQRDNFEELHPGDFAIYSSTEQYMLDLKKGFKQLVIQIPKLELLSRLPSAELLIGQKVDYCNKETKLISDSLMSFSMAAVNSNDTLQHHIQDTILDLVSTGLASISNHKYSLTQPEQALIIQIKAFINTNLTDPKLDRTMVASRMGGISVRRLSEIFSHDNNSVAAYIRKKRLDNIAREMIDYRFNQQRISQIAFRWGFENSQHFSKTFRNQYEMSPREYRNQFIKSKN